MTLKNSQKKNKEQSEFIEQLSIHIYINFCLITVQSEVQEWAMQLISHLFANQNEKHSERVKYN